MAACDDGVVGYICLSDRARAVGMYMYICVECICYMLHVLYMYVLRILI